MSERERSILIDELINMRLVLQYSCCCGALLLLLLLLLHVFKLVEAVAKQHHQVRSNKVTHKPRT